MWAAGSRVRDTLEHAIRHRPNHEEHPLKKDLHPNYVATTVTCTCGSTFQTRSTVQGGKIPPAVCPQCHPVYTGNQQDTDPGGRRRRSQPPQGTTAKKADKAPTQPPPTARPTATRSGGAGACAGGPCRYATGAVYESYLSPFIPAR